MKILCSGNLAFFTCPTNSATVKLIRNVITARQHPRKVEHLSNNRQVRKAVIIWLEYLRKRDHLKDLNIDERISKQIFDKWDGKASTKLM
jgi:hypothetical protein